MISLSAMSSSEVSGLKENLERGAVRLEFLKAVERFLKAHPLDGGADSDTVYMVGESLASENVWERISPKMVAQFVGAAYRASLEVFLEAVPEYLQNVLKELDVSELSVSRATSGSVILTGLGELSHPIEALADPLISHYPRIKADLNQLGGFWTSIVPARGSMLRSASKLGIAIHMDKPSQFVVVQKPEIKGTIILTGSEPHYVAAAKKKPKAHSKTHK